LPILNDVHARTRIAFVENVDAFGESPDQRHLGQAVSPHGIHLRKKLATADDFVRVQGHEVSFQAQPANLIIALISASGTGRTLRNCCLNPDDRLPIIGIDGRNVWPVYAVAFGRFSLSGTQFPIFLGKASLPILPIPKSVGNRPVLRN
jgi:hypothetical protein